ncbi:MULTISPECIES: phosphoribosylanthranilate isomerase [unclassified Nitratiruptor]|uniref:phosphoribosylanthranilate isomerase n=1 Tax=unclassified Nitratiruptor TaxID=2624044 RepID=UPI001914E228|nr:MULTISPECIES: phosphoribosylanthranilate isomerase [unclassified Nitratiruptor]BCD59656.1 phosphoribosylanthranilate isomerase [Nitratiruptor sp. YY08-10]BCD63580.1 phosphoribosylanthranilate isomerase [Nitratiruptor sp. YY08-14]
MRVKICGITNFEDALVAIEAGADALGFVFYEKSPRYIHPQEAKTISKKLPPFVERVGLFVYEEPAKIDEICSYCNMSLAQIHFDVEESFFEQLQTKTLPVVRAKSAEDILKFSDRYRLVDAYVPEFGGAGRRVALEWFENIDCSKIVLAGGLSPKNVLEVKRYGFYGVDVSSGVETRKGKKDPQKVREFIQKAKFE